MVIMVDNMLVDESEVNEGSTEFLVNSPAGEFSVDLKSYEQAKTNAKEQLNPPTVSLMREKIRDFVGGNDFWDSRYYDEKLGALIKYHIDKKFSDYELVKEFKHDGKVEVEPSYASVNISHDKSARFIQYGSRFYQNETEKCVVYCSTEEFGTDERIVIVSATEGRGLELIEELEASFYAEGVLKNAFFDMQFNFIKRSETVDDLLAWNTDVRKQLDKDVIEFLNVMPILRKNGLPNSRGIILSGPPGTGKTMIAKSLAAKSNVTTILISAEMINQKNEVKSIFRLGRKLAPTLMIIEDIDTAGTVSRRFTDHPILGEYLQAMDGMEPNNGMVIIATTNHTENIDPAISDRPGRFDRIIDVPLPNFAQRIGIISNILGKMPTEEISESEISKVANSSSGLSGAWIREIVQTAMIEAIYAGREKVSAADLELGLNDVLARRGLAYQSTPNLSSEIKSKNAEVYTH